MSPANKHGRLIDRKSVPVNIICLVLNLTDLFSEYGMLFTAIDMVVTICWLLQLM